MTTYICNKCRLPKPESEYFFREKGYRRKQCKSCVYIGNRSSYNHERERFRKLKTNFGLSQAQYDIIFNKQNGLCAICNKPQKKTARNRGNLCVDHDHKTNIVRGLLCSPCNTGIGLLGDSSDVLQSAARYLESAANLVS